MTDAEKEYRAQWIRDAARDLMVAEVGSDRNVMEGLDRADIVAYFAGFAEALWDLYVKERE